MRAVALIGAILLILVAVFQDDESPDTWFAITDIKIKGNLTYTSEERLMSQYTSLLSQSLLSLSISDIQAVAISPMWIETAEVRKVWPNTLQVFVHEYTPLAYWRDRQLISTSAAIFGVDGVGDLPLPRLYGPEGSSDIVLEQFGLIGQVLTSTSLRVKSLTLEPRGAWNVTFTNDIKLKLGRESVLERLQRFIAVYKSDLSGRIESITSVDARYPHGVAVGWQENN